MIADQGMDPADLPDGIAEFSESILGITFHGSARVIIIKSRLIHKLCNIKLDDFCMSVLTLYAISPYRDQGSVYISY